MKPKNALGHYHISTKELLCLAPIVKQDCESNEEVLMQLQLIDDLLGIQKMESVLDTFANFTKSGFLRKNVKRMRDYMSDRCETYIDEVEKLKQNKQWDTI